MSISSIKYVRPALQWSGLIFYFTHILQQVQAKDSTLSLDRSVDRSNARSPP